MHWEIRREMQLLLEHLPNLSDKKTMQYSHTNPTYLMEEGSCVFA